MERGVLGAGVSSKGGARRASLTLEQLIEREREAWSAFVKGDPQPSKGLFSHGDDVILANPWGPPAQG